MLLLLVVGISVTACSSTAVTPRPASEDATFLQYSDPDSRRRTSLKCGKWKRNEAKVHRSICRSTAPRSPVLTRAGICVPPTVTYLPYRRRRRARVQIAVATLSGNSLRQTVHTHCASVHQAATLVAALLRVAGVTADLAESNGSLPSGL